MECPGWGACGLVTIRTDRKASCSAGHPSRRGGQVATSTRWTSGQDSFGGPGAATDPGYCSSRARGMSHNGPMDVIRRTDRGSPVVGFGPCQPLATRRSARFAAMARPRCRVRDLCARLRARAAVRFADRLGRGPHDPASVALDDGAPFRPDSSEKPRHARPRSPSSRLLRLPFLRPSCSRLGSGVPVARHLFAGRTSRP